MNINEHLFTHFHSHALLVSAFLANLWELFTTFSSGLNCLAWPNHFGADISFSRPANLEMALGIGPIPALKRAVSTETHLFTLGYPQRGIVGLHQWFRLNWLLIVNESRSISVDLHRLLNQWTWTQNGQDILVMEMISSSLCHFASVVIVDWSEMQRFEFRMQIKWIFHLGQSIWVIHVRHPCNVSKKSCVLLEQGFRRF